MLGKITLLKFGGTSLEDAAAFERAARIVCSCKNKMRVVVVSAMSGMTDALLSSARLAARGELNQAIGAVETHIARHVAVAKKLPACAVSSIKNSQQEIESILYELHDLRHLSPKLQDQIVSYGEQLSAKLMTLILAQHGQQTAYVDARRCILTNEEHGAAQPLLEESRRLTRAALLPLLETQSIPVIGGFFAVSTSGATTTLGRGSSDYTATLLSASLHACETQIWTDVSGVFSADPQLIEGAQPIPWLSYDEAVELARFGGKVLHPKTVQPVLKLGIPVRVCNSRNPESAGTLVSAVPTGAKQNGIKAIAHKSGITVIDFASSRAFMSNGFRNAVEQIFHEHHATVDIITKGALEASLICEPTDRMPAIVENLQKLGTVRVQSDLAVICCVGTLETALLEIEPGIHWQQASNVSSITLVPAQRVGTLVSALHERLVSSCKIV